MFTVKRVLAGCLLLPVLLCASCFGKVYVDQRMYELPGKILTASVRPTQNLPHAMQVAETLDAYVQPRFEILRDKNFGAFRIVYRKHAGIVQLKVDTHREEELIANVNATHRDYAISILHCAPRPGHGTYTVTPKLQLLYFNQKQVAGEGDYGFAELDYGSNGEPSQKEYNAQAVEKRAIVALPKLMEGREERAEGTPWDVLMRPVLASKQECLQCHTNAKPGSTLGVMVYAVRNQLQTKPENQGFLEKKEATRISSRGQ